METKRQKTGGRKAGTPNVTTVRTKEALQMAFDDLGGVAALVEFGKQFPAEFYRLWVKLLPSEVNVTSPDDRTVTVHIGGVVSPDWHANANPVCIEH